MPRPSWTLLSLSILVALLPPASAQENLFSRIESQLRQAQQSEPRWATPLITTAPQLEQGFRADFVHQSTAGRQSSWSYGDAKGFQFVPWHSIELRLSPPSFYTHEGSKVHDGFGDVGFRVKYRLYGSAIEHHNAIVTAFLGATVPTGKSGNGSCCAALSPTMEAGKGFGKLALITSAGGSLPVSNTAKLGRQIVLNQAGLYRATKLLWLETEFNSTLYFAGKNDGKTQTFATPGLIVSRIPLSHADANFPGIHITLGLGEQIALTHGSTYNHSAVFTERLRF